MRIRTPKTETDEDEPDLWDTIDRTAVLDTLDRLIDPAAWNWNQIGGGR